MSHTGRWATEWLLVGPAFAASVLVNAGLFSLLGYAAFAVAFVEMGEAWQVLGLMWFGSLIYISILSAASMVCLPLVREPSRTRDALARYAVVVFAVAASGTAFTWLAGPLFPWT